jgi:hypothetical protein
MAHLERLEVEPLDRHESALTMSTVGWTLLVHDAMFVALFAPAGIRDGSLLWPTWMVVEGLFGIGLVIAGAVKEARIAVNEARLSPMHKTYRPPYEPGKVA